MKQRKKALRCLESRCRLPGALARAGLSGTSPTPGLHWAVCQTAAPAVPFSSSPAAGKTCEREALIIEKYFTFTLDFIGKFTFLIVLFIYSAHSPAPEIASVNSLGRCFITFLA